MVRKRPPAVNGGGFVVTDQNQRAVFSVDGCGILGASGQLIVRDGDGNAILFIHKKVKDNLKVSVFFSKFPIKLSECLYS